MTSKSLSSSCASKERTLNAQRFQLSFHTCLSVPWTSNKRATWAQRRRLCGQSRGEQTAVGSEGPSVWQLFQQQNCKGICRNVLGQTCRKILMSKERRNVKAKKKLGNRKLVWGVKRDDLWQVQQRDSGTREAEMFLLMKGGKGRGGQRCPSLESEKGRRQDGKDGWDFFFFRSDWSSIKKLPWEWIRWEVWLFIQIRMKELRRVCSTFTN